jgi:uncharacterized protein
LGLKFGIIQITLERVNKLKISLEELSNSPDKTVTLEFDEVIGELNNNAPVKGQVTAMLISGGVKIEGHVETEITLDCDRCLESYPYYVDIDIDEIFVKDELSSAKEVELKQENFVEELKGRTKIDVTDLVYQTIILNIPTKKLCQEECTGSEELLELQADEETDPRLEIFKNLYKDDEDNN